ncbi:MAG: M56 family metallopeptidase [Planctomycetaceae bacterium]
MITWNDFLTFWHEPNYWFEVGRLGLEGAFRLGIGAGLLAAVVLLVNLLARRWLTASQMTLLWGLVLVRLAVPMPLVPQSSLSLWGAVLDWSEGETASDSGQAYHVVSAASPHSIEVWSTDIAARAPHGDETAPPAATDWWEIAEIALPCLWLMAWLAVPAWTLLRHWRFRRQVHSQLIAVESRVDSLWRECCGWANWSTATPLLMSRGIAQPAVTGVWRPCLLLPDSAANWSDNQLRMVMLHELSHLKRRDVLVNWLLVLVRAAQWWNPVYWLAASRFRQLREQACDAFALRHMSETSSADYGRLLLEVAASTHIQGWKLTLPASLVGLFRSRLGRSDLDRRLRALSSAKTVLPRWQRWGFIALAVVAGVCGLTNPRMEAAQRNEPIEWIPDVLSQTGEWTFGRAPDLSPVEVRRYPVGGLLDKWSAEAGGRELAEIEIGTLLQMMLAAPVEALLDEPLQPIEPIGPPHHERVRFDGGEVEVLATQATHQEIPRLLQLWEEHGLQQITIECRLIWASHDLLDAIDLDWDHLSAELDESTPVSAEWSDKAVNTLKASSRVDNYLPVAVKTLTDAQVRQLIQKGQEDTRSNIFFAPKVTLFNGQAGQIFSGVQRPFVVGLEPTTGTGVQPVLEIVTEGTTVGLRAVAHKDSDVVQIDSTIEMQSIEEVRVVKIRMAGEERAIQVPRTRRDRISTAGVLRLGESRLLGCVHGDDRAGFFYVLLTPRLIDDGNAGDINPVATP